MSNESLIGRTIGNYRIISRLGRGGMATVYRARQVNMGRDVAIKVMSAELAEDPQYEARFEREAQVIASLQHPRVLPVHDFGHQDDLFYLVMRVIEGESLYQRLMRGALPLHEAARYVNQIAEALDYAHSQGVIHRDLKPNNVLMDELDNVYLMDFGLAKMLAATHSLTQTGTVIGTPQYMAPEQWRGEPVDARTDVYSLGVILYEMVVGKPPFESDTPFTLMYKHVNDPPPAPREVLPALPEPVEAVILKALSKDPAARYESAGALARDLTRSLRAANVPGAQNLVPPPVVALPAPEDSQEPALPDVAEEAAPQAAEEAAQEAAGEASPAPQAEPQVEPESAPEPAPEPAPDDESESDIPLPAEIIPPPPPIPVPGAGVRPRQSAPPDARPPSEEIRGVPDSSPPPSRHPAPPEAPASKVRRAYDVMDQGLESMLEKAALAAPPLASRSDPNLRVKRGVQYTPQGEPLNAPAQEAVRAALTPGEDLIGVLDVRGTHQWRLAKQMLIGGLALNLVGGLLSVGFFHLLGWIAWVILLVQGLRTWRGEIGRYYLGFTSQRVILLPRDSDNDPLYNAGRAVAWAHVERMRLTDRYVLLDMPDGEGGTVSLGALIPAEGDGGLGQQTQWLPHSPIKGLVAGEGFEVRDV